MSIASAIQTLTNTIRGIASTKQDIKSAVNTDFEAIANEQIEQYPNLIRNAINQYKSYIPVTTGEGKQVSLNTVPLKMKEFAVKGDTFQQQYEGKNLIPTQVDKWEQGAITTAEGTNSDNTTRVRTIDYYPIQELTDYYLSVEDTTYCFVNLFLYDSNKNYITNYYTITHSITGATSITVNFPANTAYYRAVMRNKTDSSAIIEPSVILTAKPMLALGTTKTTYEPYVGGTPAPNPDYPQPIQVVTGEQTVHIGDTTKTLNLGNMELCKIGDYQDYIYKENGNWYKHKVINKYICTGEENWVYSSSWSKTNTNVFYANVKNDINFPDWNSNTSICNYFITYSRNGMYSLDDNGFCFSGTAGITGASFTVRINKAIATDLAAFKSWLGTHNTILYYELKTAVDEQITDTTLINQLEAIEQTNMNNGTTIIYAENEEGLQPTLYVEAYKKEAE